LFHPDVVAIVPARNEREIIATTVAALREHVRVLVVDNGSSDGTGDLAVAAGATVVREQRPGYGRAVLAGLHHLALTPPAIVVIFDADLADDPDRLDEILGPLIEDKADLVLSDRTVFAEPGALTPTQHFGNWLARTLIRRLTGHPYRDLGPLRAMRWQTWQDLGLQDPTWGFNVEIQIKAARRGLRILEVPLPYRRRQAGTSKISGTLIGSARAGYRILATIARHRDD
jgi:glycosyltransferase involved in cell wall biosynthesis